MTYGMTKEYSAQPIPADIFDPNESRDRIMPLASLTWLLIFSRRSRLMSFWSRRERDQACFAGPLENDKETVYRKRRLQSAQLVAQHPRCLGPLRRSCNSWLLVQGELVQHLGCGK